MTNGTSQHERFPRGLDALDTLADGQALEDALATMRDYAARLGFGDPRDHATGTWATLLDRDESFLLARLLTVPVAALERAFLDNADAGRIEHLAAMHASLTGFVREWLVAFGQLAPIDATDEAGAAFARVMVAQTELDPTWEDRLETGFPPSGHERRVRVAFFARTDDVRRMQALARQRFEPALITGRHEPAAGLLLALTKAQGRIQARINRFPDRLADFYFYDCLGQGPADPVPDKVHLTFQRDSAFAEIVTIPQGQMFEALSPVDGRPARFSAETSLVVTDATVAALHSLRAERDPRNSPECLFGFATRLALADLSGPSAERSGRLRVPAPLFGGKLPGLDDTETEAPIGIAVSSPMLALAQGDRTIWVAFELDVPGFDATLRAINAATTADAFAGALGMLFVNWLLSDEISEAQLADIADQVRKVGEPGTTGSFLDDSLKAISRVAGEPQFADELMELVLGPAGEPTAEHRPVDLQRRRRIVRDMLFPRLFMIQLSASTGWLAIADPLPISGPDPARATPLPALLAGRGRFGLRLELGPAFPPIVPCIAVHGSDWNGSAPTVRLLLNPMSRVFGLSIFDQVRLASVNIEVAVAGLRGVELQNQLGQIDPAMPFLPFGPLPDPSSYLIVGSPEIAAKAVTHCELHLEWAGLPADGFASHYRGYPEPVDDERFTATPAILRNGTWVAAGEAQPLFRAPVDSAPPIQTIVLSPAALTSNWQPAPPAGRYGVGSMNGFVRLRFTTPASGFGAGVYPTSLAEALRAKPRDNVMPPRPPVSPRVVRLTLSYRASTTIHIGRDSAGETVVHVYPLGTRTIHPATASGTPPTMLPALGRDGQLLIGLSGDGVMDDLSLLFDLAPYAAFDRVDDIQPDSATTDGPVWAFLSEDGWVQLETWRQVRDTTRGFVRSGIVQLKLPRRLPKAGSIQPGGLAWLGVSTNALSGQFAVLRGVTTQAVAATRVGMTPESPLPSGSIGTRSASIPGILAINQPGPGFDLRKPETLARERTRIGERLRHKHRATTAWDFERLVLEAFPQIAKAKCLPNSVAQTGSDDEPGRSLLTHPGAVLIVVVPRHPEGVAASTRDMTAPFGVDRWEIGKIRDYLLARCSPHAKVDVISATFERIQVRCHVELGADAHDGSALRAVNDAIIGYLSPWSDHGIGPMFDWAIRSDDLHAVIRHAHTQIRAVSGVSVIRVWEDDRLPVGAPARRLVTYLLEDSAPSSNGGAPADIRASRPWSLPLPFDRHIIELIGQADRPSAQLTGIAAKADAANYDNSVSGLQIGETFVIET